MIDTGEIRARAEAATPGPWASVFTDYFRGVYTAGEGRFTQITAEPEMDDRENDREFIACARDDVPALCDEVDALRAELAAEKARAERLRAYADCHDPVSRGRALDHILKPGDLGEVVG